MPFKNKSAVNLIDDSVIFKIRMRIAGLMAGRMAKSCSHPAWQGKGQNVTLTTLVLTHNLLGRIYLAVIMPFHRLVVRAMLRQVHASDVLATLG